MSRKIVITLVLLLLIVGFGILVFRGHDSKKDRKTEPSFCVEKDDNTTKPLVTENKTETETNYETENKTENNSESETEKKKNEVTQINISGYKPIYTREDYEINKQENIQNETASSEKESDNNQSGNIDKYNDKTDNDKTDNDETTKYIISDKNIEIISVGYYDGAFVEDGTDDEVAGVVAIVLKNNSDKMLQVGMLEYELEGEKAEFKITNLLPGQKALVMESGRRIYKESDDYSYGRISTAYIDYNGVNYSDFGIEEKDGSLTLENKTDRDISQVYVYYKNCKVNDIYIGGITYRIPIDDIAAGTKKESVANHFLVGKSEIVDIQITRE